MRTIAIVTGTRADYGLLSLLMRAINSDPALKLQVIATGMHLAAGFGDTVKVIEADGFGIDARVELPLSGDSAVSTVKAMGVGLVGFADALERLRPDLLVLTGDRCEMLVAAQAALVLRIPVAHLFGGDSTEGAFDEAMRHSITKMAHLHFVSNERSAARVRQLGEDPARVFMVGSPGIDQILQSPRLDRHELTAQTGYTFRPRNLLITFHPATLDATPAEEQFAELLMALDRLGSECGLFFTYPNADPNGRALIAMIETFVADRAHAKACASLGQIRYLSMLAQVDALVGNSSSGLYEAPSFRIPTVNIGDRQQGRLKAASVIDCAAKAGQIEAALEKALQLDCSRVVNPYGDGRSVPRIVERLKTAPLGVALLKKHFFDRE